MAKDEVKDDGTQMIGVIISKKYIALIDAWADRLRHSRSKMSRIVLESAIEDDGWMWGLISSPAGRRLLNFFGRDAHKPLDDEEEQVVRDLIGRASQMRIATILHLCDEELKKRGVKAA